MNADSWAKCRSTLSNLLEPTEHVTDAHRIASPKKSPSKAARSSRSTRGTHGSATPSRSRAVGDPRFLHGRDAEASEREGGEAEGGAVEGGEAELDIEAGTTLPRFLRGIGPEREEEARETAGRDVEATEATGERAFGDEAGGDDADGEDVDDASDDAETDDAAKADEGIDDDGAAEDEGSDPPADDSGDVGPGSADEAGGAPGFDGGTVAVQAKCSACGHPSGPTSRPDAVQRACPACGERVQPATEGSGIQRACAECGSNGSPMAAPGAVQRSCASCDAEGTRWPAASQVQKACSDGAGGGPRASGGRRHGDARSPAGSDRGAVQSRCDACGSGVAPQVVVQSQAVHTLRVASVQSRLASAGPSTGSTVQMWDCTSYSKPSCSRESTPLNRLVQTRCDGCDPEPAEAEEASPEAADEVDGVGLIHDHARRGLQGASSQLPHYQRIQAAFGRHDLSSVRVQIGGRAREAAQGMGALAYASGERIAFRDSPDLHLVAHEAAHIVQQRAGIRLPGGVGAVGDRWEQHADRVADAVVAGRSAEPLLDEVGGRSEPSVSATVTPQAPEIESGPGGGLGPTEACTREHARIDAIDALR